MAEKAVETIKVNNKFEALDDENYTTVDFELDGKTVSAKMTSAMVAFLNENENLKKQIIEKLIADSGVKQEETVMQLSDNGEDKEHVEVGDHFRWYVDPTMALLELYLQNIQGFNDNNVKTAPLWQKIAKGMEEKGYKVKGSLCDRKMRNLKAGYRAKQRKIIETGRLPRWKYFPLLDKIYGEMSNNVQINWESDSDSFTTSDESSSCCELSETEFSKSHNSEQQGHNKTKKMKLSEDEDTEDVREAWGFELMRRTYIQIERRKAKAMSKVTHELTLMRRMQEERNNIMKNMLEEMRKMNR